MNSGFSTITWLVIETDTHIHVLPDHGNHTVDTPCHCSPQSEQHDRELVIHNTIQ